MVAPGICNTGVPTLFNISVMARVESVSNARRARSYMSFTLSMYCAGLVGSTGSATLTTGFGLFSQPREVCRRCSRSRTLVKYWSSRLRSSPVTFRCSSLACRATVSRMLRPVSSSRILASISAGVPWRNICRKTDAAFAPAESPRRFPSGQAPAAVDGESERGKPRQRRSVRRRTGPAKWCCGTNCWPDAARRSEN